MTAFVEVARVDDVPDQSAICVEVAGRRIALFNLGGTFFAIDDNCTHADAPLSEGQICGGEVACPLHAATFDIATGAATGPPAYEDVETYPVRVVDGAVEVAVG